MSAELNEQQIAKIFWCKFVAIEPDIYNNILKRNNCEYNQSVNQVLLITKELGIYDKIGIHFGIDIRNGMPLNERKDIAELIISPLFQRTNQTLVHALYAESFNHNLPKYWSVIKYKYHRASNINSVTLNYPIQNNSPNEMSESIQEITKEDFSYFPILNEQKTKLSILLFIKDDKAKFLIKKEKYNDRDIWIPSDTGIYAVLDSAIGEYDLLNTLDKMEIHLESDLDNDDFKDVISLKIENIINDIEMIHNHPLSNFHKCSRCEYSNKQVKLYICKCKNVYYCDSICQKAHRELHVLGGCV